MYRGTEYTVDFVPKVKIEVICSDANLQTVLDTVMRTAQTGQIGDGKIFVSSLDEIIRIRTGEKRQRLALVGSRDPISAVSTELCG